MYIPYISRCTSLIVKGRYIYRKIIQERHFRPVPGTLLLRTVYCCDCTEHSCYVLYIAVIYFTSLWCIVNCSYVLNIVEVYCTSLWSTGNFLWCRLQWCAVHSYDVLHSVHSRDALYIAKMYCTLHKCYVHCSGVLYIAVMYCTM